MKNQLRTFSVFDSSPSFVRVDPLSVREKFMRYYGERCAQLNVDESVRGPNEVPHSWWFIIVTWLLFWTPQIYLEKIHRVFVDQLVNYYFWRKFISELQDDWNSSITPVRPHPLRIASIAADNGLSRPSSLQPTSASLQYRASTMAVYPILTGRWDRS